MKHYVYVLQELGNPHEAPVKIGVATNVWKRRDVLQTGNPRQLIVKFYMGPFSQKEAYEIESSFHDEFKPQRGIGEWFRGKILHKKSLLKFIRVNQYPAAYSIGGILLQDLECLITEQDEKPNYRVACQ